MPPISKARRLREPRSKSLVCRAMPRSRSQQLRLRLSDLREMSPVAAHRPESRPIISGYRSSRSSIIEEDVMGPASEHHALLAFLLGCYLEEHCLVQWTREI